MPSAAIITDVSPGDPVMQEAHKRIPCKNAKRFRCGKRHHNADRLPASPLRRDRSQRHGQVPRPEIVRNLFQHEIGDGQIEPGGYTGTVPAVYSPERKIVKIIIEIIPCTMVETTHALSLPFPGSSFYFMMKSWKNFKINFGYHLPVCKIGITDGPGHII